MSFLNRISPNGMWMYRIFYPQGKYYIDFKLDDESKYLLGDACGSTSDEANLIKGVEGAAYHLVFTIPYTELAKVQISEVMRTVIDPTNNSRLFLLNLRKGEGNNHLLVTKARVILKELPKEGLIVEKLKSNPLKVKIVEEDASPIIIIFSIDEESRAHLDDIESMCENKNEVDTIRKNIQRAIGEWIYENINGVEQGRTYERKVDGALDDEKEYEFLFTIVDYKKIIVNKVKLYERDLYKFQ